MYQNIEKFMTLNYFNCDELQLFYKQIPAMFIRMKENASRLLYESKQQLNTLQENIHGTENLYI